MDERRFFLRIAILGGTLRWLFECRQCDYGCMPCRWDKSCESREMGFIGQDDQSFDKHLLFTGGAPLKIFFNLVGGLIKFASSKLKGPKAIPGVWAMNPNSDFIKKLNKSSSSIGGEVVYNTIGSDFEPSGIFKGGIKDDIADSIADVYFGDPNDLVVDTDKMAVPWPKRC